MTSKINPIGTSSVISVDHHPIAVNSDDTFDNNDSIRRVINSSSTLDYITTSIERQIPTTNVRLCSLTEMLLLYAQQDIETSKNLYNILSILELHFNTYANDKQQIYFEGIFQILNDFHEQITELVLVETMQFLQIDLFVPCNFENFVLILCHLPPIKQDSHSLLNIFNELDHNKDSYITLEDIQYVLPHLTSHCDEDIIRTAIHTIDIDQDNDRLSYFDFVISLIALKECKLNMKTNERMNLPSTS
ncbi:hypothetical protein I4U23_006374 [Adineta vaga]|nr:hypothetical protein I4U23_006374 [Adineta vaga]